MRTRLLLSALALVALFASGCTYKSIQNLSIKNDKFLNKIKKPPEVPNYLRGIVWCHAPCQNLSLDVSWPDGEGPFPIVVNIHGGAFFMGTNAIDEAFCRHLTNRGYTVFNINYRMAPDFQFPAAVNDCLGAIIWAKHNALDFNGDPSRVAVSGGSAGGNLAAMVAYAWNDDYFSPTYQVEVKRHLRVMSSSYTPPIEEEKALDASVQAAVLIFPVMDMAIMSHPGSSMKNPYLGGTIETVPELFKKSSPITYMNRPDLPPTMLVCGDKDGLYTQAEEADKILSELGVPHQFYTAHGKGHGFTNWHWQPAAHAAYEAIADWLDIVLKQ